MKSELSLISILNRDADLTKKLERLTQEVKEDKLNLIEAAEEYNREYEAEVIEGTKKKQKLLTDGYSRGMSKDDAEKYAYQGGFLPSIQIPILNFLYFLLRETEEIDREMEVKRVEYNKMYGHLQEPDDILSENIEKPPEMFEYLYANMTLETFNKLKKLKSLTKSNNIKEATLAFKKCRELCDKYGLDYEKIPCRY